MKEKVLKVNAQDNVLVALVTLQKGDVVDYKGEHYILLDDVMKDIL